MIVQHLEGINETLFSVGQIVTDNIHSEEVMKFIIWGYED